MSIRIFSLGIGLTLLVAACGRGPADPPAATTIAEPSKKSNVVWILLDAARAENFSCNGYSRETTPNMDALAKRGATFQTHYAQTNNTLRSVPSYMTGRYFAVSSLNPRGRVPYVRRRPAGEILFPEMMAENGFRTAMYSAHLSFVQPGSALWHSFDESFTAKKGDSPGPLPAFSDINREVLPWLEHQGSEPFFLYVHSVDTHFPHVLEPPYDRWVDPNFDRSHLHEGLTGQTIERKDGQPYSRADKEHLRGLYDGSLAYADAHVGQIIDKLESLGILDETIIVISSDHGEALGEDGRTMEHSRAGTSDAVLRVPLIVAGPGIPRRGAIKDLTANVDIVPTLVDALGLETAAEMHGNSLRPLLDGRVRSAHPEGVLAWHIGAQPAHPILATYHDTPAMLWITENGKYETDPTTGQSFLWTMPDNLKSRNDLLQRGWKKDIKLAERMQKHINEIAVPLREAYLALPYSEIELEAPALAMLAESQESFAWFGDTEQSDLSRDGKWHVSNFFLVGGGDGEDAPPLTVRLPVPNGTYAVDLSLLHDPGSDQRVAASALRIRLQNDAKFRTVDTRTKNLDGKSMPVFELGQIEISDGQFTAVLDDTPGNVRTVIHRLRLRDPNAALPSGETTSLEEQSLAEEALRAMGYN